MDSENSGETSKKKSHDKNDGDRPLKKARYLWQVKGNYHLKDNNSSGSNENVPETPETSWKEPGVYKVYSPTQCSDVSTNTIASNDDDNKGMTNDINPVTDDSEKSNKILYMNWTSNNNIMRTRNNNYGDSACIEKLIACSDKIMEFPELENPRNIERSISDEIPITLVTPRPKNEDFYLRKWQARQIAKGFVDNTINRVLENWMVAPFDAGDLIENADNGGQVEDEGIMMAIQSHGLQSGANRPDNCSVNNPHDVIPRYNNKDRKLFSMNECNCSSKTRRAISPPPPIPFHNRPMGDMEVEYYHNLCILKNTEPVRSNQMLNPGKPKSTFEPLHSEDSKENDPTLNHISDDMQDIILPDSYDTLGIDDSDFLDAAVSAAIRKKGLTSYSCVDYG